IAQAPDVCIEQLPSYFLQRSYGLVDAESTTDKRTFEGFVRPSIFLAILLFILAGIGCLCLGLVLAILFPQWNSFVWAIILLAPGASIFYWKKSARREQVSFKVETVKAPDATPDNALFSSIETSFTPQTKVTVRGHRDELASLQAALAQSSLTIQTLDHNP
ncbi:MAG: cofactor assembly of complex C subunit B, partial [Merismopedia sp. SIO2A8]|nr:cofactor assembly of complex C subunit B [Merismopedia sp. SIO2A8]